MSSLIQGLTSDSLPSGLALIAKISVATCWRVVTAEAQTATSENELLVLISTQSTLQTNVTFIHSNPGSRSRSDCSSDVFNHSWRQNQRQFGMQDLFSAAGAWNQQAVLTSES